jgi:hypothetical protein
LEQGPASAARATPGSTNSRTLLRAQQATPTDFFPASACIFHDVTRRDVDLPCGQNCNGLFVNSFGASGSTIIAERSSSNSKNETACRATVGYGLATGLGSVGATKLFNAWAQLQ